MSYRRWKHVDLSRLEELRSDVLKKLEKTQAARKVAHDKKRIPHDLAIGDFVLD